ncbi:hypothetical protein NLI96_g6932 [Meripilus lineatus]|uniref:Uncharacterized protein n=1 Tax=Meripilus lineatus TaxID=2056292 RepID=A0AAD5V1S2_9APHY|nr:hypothetical protein NLI96_g6932 [Physisporinus lineatus]
MRASFFAVVPLVAATLVASAPLDTRGNTYIPSFAKGGNAQSGNSGNANGGGVYNAGWFVDNTAYANKAGKGGLTQSGTAQGGSGYGGGGSAVSGNTGNANGGDVQNYGGILINGYKSNQAGNGGVAQSGNAYGGNAWKRGNSFNFGKGGNSQSGNTGNVDGGNVVNAGGKIINTPFANQAGKGGLTQSGLAVGGNGKGGGGSAVSGNTGNSNGGSVGNFGGVIVNGYKSNTAGNGGTSKSGDAVGGYAYWSHFLFSSYLGIFLSLNILGFQLHDTERISHLGTFVVDQSLSETHQLYRTIKAQGFEPDLRNELHEGGMEMSLYILFDKFPTTESSRESQTQMSTIGSTIFGTTQAKRNEEAFRAVESRGEKPGERDLGQVESRQSSRTHARMLCVTIT